MLRWHPNASRQIFGADGKPWVGGKGNRKLLLHTIEANGWPNYSAPPHMTLNPNTGELRQHVPFDESAYALRLNAGEDDRWIWQVELWGRAANTPTYQDVWYYNLAALIRWFVEQMGVPHHYADFTVMDYGEYAPQRMTQDEMDDFAGIVGHAHHGRGTDSHWDPGRLDVERLIRFVDLGASESPQPPEEGDYEMRTVRYGDGSRDAPDPSVIAAQAMATGHGYRDHNTIDEVCGNDGIFRSGTESQMKAFQAAKGLTADGIVGSKTWNALEGSIA